MVHEESEAMGAARELGVRVKSDREVIGIVRRGLPAHALRAIEDKLGVTRPVLSALLSIPERTLARRMSGEPLSKDESDRVFRAARAYHMAVATLGTPDKARRWLSKANVALGGVAPITLLDTETGGRQVENVLGHVASGDAIV
jgi:putative toxin-antitoxin system antitoxin component (TIGR02293 family)